MNERLRRWGPTAAIVLLAIAVSALSLGNMYAYDDGAIVYANDRVHSLAHIPALFAEPYWGRETTAGGYRPLTLAMFALEWFLGGGRPIAMHLANVLIYAALCWAVYALARRVLPPVAAWFAAALFAVHPVHVEAVANMVGQAELIAALACVAGVVLYVRERDQGLMRWPAAFAVFGCFVAATLAKENGVMFPLFLLAAELTIVRDPRPVSRRFVTARPFVLLLTLGGAIYLWVRMKVLGDVAGMPPHVAYVGLHMSNAHRVLTMIGMAKEWTRLLLWPWHLVAEYSPPLVPLAIEMSPEQLPGLLAIVVTLATLWASVKHGWRDIAFGISWVIAAMLPISGFLFATGFILAERTMMLPSVGAMIVVAALGWRLWESIPESGPLARPARIAFAAITGTLLLAGAVRSELRQPVWRDNDALFSATVKDAPTSYRAHQIMATWLFIRDFKGEGEQEMLQAIRLFPYDPIPPYLLAEQYRKVGACERALPLYRWSLEVTDTAAGFALAPYARCLVETGDYTTARAQALRGISRGDEVWRYRRLLRQVDSSRIARTHPDSLEHWLRLPGTRVGASRVVASKATR